MRWLVVVLFLIPGCTMGGPDCGPSSEVAQGIRVQLVDFDGVVGECLELSNGLDGAMAAPVYAEIGADGLVWFEAPPAGTYWVSVTTPPDWSDDCGHEWFDSFDYVSGIVTLELRPQVTCP